MAKKTKAANLSIEEKLEQALIVPGYEPYKIPDNWCWTNLKTVCNLDNGIKHNNESLVYFDAKTLREITEPVSRNSGVIVEKGQKVILVDGENSGEVFVIPDRGYMGSTFRILNISKQFDEMYIRYFIDIFREELKKNKIGSAIPHLNKELFYGLQFPLPPLPEQQRIVERIESLFSKLDEAKEKAQEVINSFETRKAAILHKAFSGELTAKWREENGVGIESWESTKIGNMLTEIKYGTSEKSDYSFDGIPVFRIPNISDMTLIFDDVKKIQRQECSENEYLSENDILIIRSNGSKELVGKCALVPKINFKCTYASFLIRLRMKDSISSLYTVWYLTSEQARKQLFNKAKSSAGIHNINSKEISDISIVVPSKPEQNIITATLERLITKEKETVIFAESVIDQIDAMKKAILARAFRGELGTNDSKEESAVELLKQILSGE